MILNALAVAQPTKINYTVTFPDAQAHYTHIEMTVTGLTERSLNIKMPVWTPGSYLVREFAKNVEALSAEANGKPIVSAKISKNTWHIESNGATSVKINYKVYCFEVSVRTSFIDTASAFLSTSGLFMYPDGMLHEPSTIQIKPYKGWTTVSTSLGHIDSEQFTLHAPDYDVLYDSPIQVGTQAVFGFEAAGVKYEVAMCGGGNYNTSRLIHDMTQIIEKTTTIFGENPNKHYVFIVHNYLKGGGGLEHLSSTVLGATRDGYTNETIYHNFLGLVAHEHFHLWNVKRLRPFALGPFNYDVENYTHNLWVAEGFTTYYQSVIIRSTGMYPIQDYLNIIADDMSMVDNQPGTKVQSLNDASFDAWIKYYRPNENSPNATISYYSKGAVVAMMLDLQIIHYSNGKRSLDDFMKYMYHQYYTVFKRGYTNAEFKTEIEKFTGNNLDDFYAKFIYGVNDLDYQTYLSYAGYKIINTLQGSNAAYLGTKITATSGKNIVTTVLRNSPAWKAGISVNDEIQAIEGNVVLDVDKYIVTKKPGEKINISVIRDGVPTVISVLLENNPQVKYHLTDDNNISDEKMTVRKKWLRLAQ